MWRRAVTPKLQTPNIYESANCRRRHAYFPYLGQQLPHHAVPLPGLLVLLPIFLVRHYLERVVELWNGRQPSLEGTREIHETRVSCELTQYVGDLLDEVDGVALEAVVAGEALLRDFVHRVGLTLEWREGAFNNLAVVPSLFNCGRNSR